MPIENIAITAPPSETQAQEKTAKKEKTRERIEIPVREKQVRRGAEFLRYLTDTEATPIILSPHADDAELSLAGFIQEANEKTNGRLRHTVVFSQATAELEELSQTRKEEVIEADAILGLNPDQINFLDEQDLLYRRAERDRISIPQAIRHPRLIPETLQQRIPQTRSLPLRAASDNELLNRMAQQFRTMAEQTANPVFFVPLAGIRRHNDHYLTRIAAEQAVRQISQDLGREVPIIYYDEHPYNQHLQPLSLKLAGALKPAQYTEHQEQRRKAIGKFESQLKIVYQPHGNLPDLESLPPERFFIPTNLVNKMHKPRNQRPDDAPLPIPEPHIKS